MSKFISVFRELATFKELLRSQVSEQIVYIWQIFYDIEIAGHDCNCVQKLVRHFDFKEKIINLYC